MKDRSGELSDEIIVFILSFLTMKEAGQMSVLSKRWRYVWADIPILNFDDSNTFDELKFGDKSLELETSWYLRWVNQVVGSYRVQLLKSLEYGLI